MPARTYWVIVAGATPTAFRARDRESLLPTLHQLQRKQPDVVLRWFERTRFWESPLDAEHDRARQEALRKQRGPAWRPGGSHKDPRARYELTRDQKRARWKKRAQGRPDGPAQGAPGKPWESRPPQGAPGKPWRGKATHGAPRKPWQGKPAQGASGKPWQGKPPQGAPGKPWRDKPHGAKGNSGRGGHGGPARGRGRPVKPSTGGSVRRHRGKKDQ